MFQIHNFYRKAFCVYILIIKISCYSRHPYSLIFKFSIFPFLESRQDEDDMAEDEIVEDEMAEDEDIQPNKRESHHPLWCRGGCGWGKKK